MTIKETAGKVLLYFYQLQRTAPLTMPYRQLGFIERKDTAGMALSSDKKWLTKDLQTINPVAEDTYNAFKFLLDKKYIESKDRITAGARVYVGIQLTHKGIDIVEGIEGGDGGVHDFVTTFNISVSGGATVEDVMKEQLSALLD